MSRSESGSGAVARAWSWLLGVLVFLVLLQLVWAMFQSVVPGLLVIGVQVGLVGWALRSRSGW